MVGLYFGEQGAWHEIATEVVFKREHQMGQFQSVVTGPSIEHISGIHGQRTRSGPGRAWSSERVWVGIEEVWDRFAMRGWRLGHVGRRTDVVVACDRAGGKR